MGFDLEQLRHAQARYTKRLLDCIPEGVHDVLDVGCGVGDNASAMSDRGYRVISISPDANHSRYFEAMSHDRITFYRSTYEAFESPQPVDLVLFSESVDYIDHRVGLEKSRRFLRPGGYLLVSGMFPIRNEVTSGTNSRIEKWSYVEKAREYGFSISYALDITHHCAPTLDMAHGVLETHLRPLFELGVEYLRRHSPLRFWLLRLFFWPQLRHLSKVAASYKKRIDPLNFRNRWLYAIVLLRQQT